MDSGSLNFSGKPTDVGVLHSGLSGGGRGQLEGGSVLVIIATMTTAFAPWLLGVVWYKERAVAVATFLGSSRADNGHIGVI